MGVINGQLYQEQKKESRFKTTEQMPFRYESFSALMNNAEVLRSMVEDFITVKRPRLDRLDDYYMTENTGIYARDSRSAIDNSLSDHRVSHAFATYISSFITSYTVGNPITVQHEDEQFSDLVATFNKQNDVDTHNYEVCTDSSIYGEGFELLYRAADDSDRLVHMPKLNTFIIYDDTLQKKEIAAVNIRRVIRNNTAKTVLTVYSDTHIYESEPLEDSGDKIILNEIGLHPYGEVPVVSFKNNRFGIGDYERVIPQIDAYDAAQSDTANYMSDLTDAVLAISGSINPSLSADDIIKLKKARIMMLEHGIDPTGRSIPSSAQYLYKQYDVEGVEAFKRRLENDIHKLSYTPNFSDEKIGGNGLSGEAISYRLVGLNQVRKIKETYYAKGIVKRYRMLARANGLDVHEQVTVTFHPNLPKAVLEELKTYRSAGGQLSQETMLSLLSFVENPADEIKKIEEEIGASELGNFDDTFGFGTPSTLTDTEFAEAGNA